tara:strand:+ start:21 stop:551 length:531 start_codon:yes stop_codon:yes gene_type:complete
MAVTTIPSAGITDATIDTADIKDDAVTAAKAAFGLGKIGQVLQGQNATEISTSISDNDQDIVTQSITPSASSSKILVIGTVMGIQGGTSSSNTRWNCKMYRDSNLIHYSQANRWDFTTEYERDGGFSIQWLESPSSTSALNYRLTSNWSDTGGGTCYVNKDGNSGYSTITLMEILA